MNYRNSPKIGLSILLISLISMALTLGDWNSPPRGIDNANRGELMMWSLNKTTTEDAVPAGLYLADYLPRSVRNQALEYNQTFNCIDLKTRANHSGMLYISGLYPTTDSILDFEIGIDQDGRAESYINTSSVSVMIHRDNGTYRLYSIWYSNNGSIRRPYLEIPQVDASHNKIKFTLINNENDRHNIIKFNDSLQLKTPYVYAGARYLPYTFLSHPILQICNKIFSNGTYCTLHIYSIEQRIPRRIVTPFGTRRESAFGLDGPHSLDKIVKGVEYMTEKGHTGTIWADVRYVDANNIPFIKNLLDDGWELGIHYSKELSTLPQEQAYSLMSSEYINISKIFSIKPTSWCSLRNRDNINHAIFAYNELGMIWRNGNAGVYYFPNVGNLDNSTWNWWKESINNSAIYPSFSHRLDEEHAIAYSIDHAKFKTFIDGYTNSDIKITGFERYYKTNANQKEAKISILKKNKKHLVFSIKTNGYPCNVNVFPEEISSPINVTDLTAGKASSFHLNDDLSVAFEALDDHTYNISYDSGS